MNVVREYERRRAQAEAMVKGTMALAWIRIGDADRAGQVAGQGFHYARLALEIEEEMDMNRRHNYGQKCTEKPHCDCARCCLCAACLFDRRSASIYRGMQSRFGAKKWKTGERAGEIRREARPIPFTLDQFRDWLRVVLEDEPHCVYCGAQINIQTISPDHYKPASRGGSLALSNLRPCDELCNAIKGELLPGEFKALLAGLKTFTEDGRKNVISRLRGSAVHIHHRKPAAQQAAKKDSATPVLAFPPMGR